MTEKETLTPSCAVTSLGCAVISARLSMVSFAASLVTLPSGLDTMQRKRLPSKRWAARKEKTGVLYPAELQLTQEAPSFAEYCHL